MNKAHTRIVWENSPSENTPLSAQNLNSEDIALDTVDDRVITLDTTKANQTDLLTCLSNVTYNSSTGIFVFTWKNGNTYQVDLNIEKIPVSFTMSAQGVITMTTADGTVYSCDISTLIKTYGFVDTTEFAWNMTTDASGNHVVTLSLVDGGITEDKLETNFLADCRTAKTGAETAQAQADADALVSEGWAVGEQQGIPVTSGSPYYENNAKYYAQQAGSSSLASLSDVTISGAQNGQHLEYDSSLSKWTNKTPSIPTGTFFGTCVTARSALDKVVVCPDFSSLISGSMVAVKFTDVSSSNPASGNFTLNVNSTGAKAMKFKSTYGDVTYSSGDAFYNNAVCIFVYDGTNWIFYNDNNSTYTPPTLGFGYGVCTTAQATTAKVATLANYNLIVGGFVSIKFTYAVPASATLNVNSKGAKPIFYKGSAITAGIISAGDTATFVYDGTDYHLISIDSGGTSNYNDFTLTTTWTSNTSVGDYATYPYKQTISTSLYNANSANDWKYLAGTPTNMPNSAEIASMKYLSQFAQFDTTGITFIATNPTTTNLTIRVMG